MAIPSQQAIRLLVLRLLADGKARTISEITSTLADQIPLSEEDRSAKMSNGEPTFRYRIGWVRSFLRMNGLVTLPERGKVQITDKGQGVLRLNPTVLSEKVLRELQIEGTTDLPPEIEEQEESPIELMASLSNTLNTALKDELLARLKQCSPAFFERAVVKLLMAMGYGGITGDGLVTGQSGDGGLDGIIREDKLGLDLVGVQAKRWEGTVSRPTVQQFVGALDMVKAKKGVILTTSGFSREAKDFVDRIEGKKVVLIDGPRLAELMIQHGIGVATVQTYEVKQLSGDFFEEDEG